MHKLIVAHLVLPFMEPEGALLCSQQPTTEPCPEPDEFNPHSHILFIQD
jgi:hypothetical protein